MSREDIKIGMIEVLKKMVEEYRSKGSISSLSKYNTGEVSYGYLRKIPDSGVITKTSKSKKASSFKWNENPNPSQRELEALATRVVTYSPTNYNLTNNAEDSSFMGFNRGEPDIKKSLNIGVGRTSENPSGRKLYSVDDIVELTMILKKYEIREDLIPIIVKDIIKL